MASSALLIVRTAHHRYAIRRDDMVDMKLLHQPQELADAAQFPQPCVGVELGALLDPADQSSQRRRHALLVPLRRRYVALLVDQVEQIVEHAEPMLLPALLRERLRQPWACGSLLIGEELIILLDLRAVARSALLTRSA